jgi:hypothetical protein
MKSKIKRNNIYSRNKKYNSPKHKIKRRKKTKKIKKINKRQYGGEPELIYYIFNRRPTKTELSASEFIKKQDMFINKRKIVCHEHDIQFTQHGIGSGIYGYPRKIDIPYEQIEQIQLYNPFIIGPEDKKGIIRLNSEKAGEGNINFVEFSTNLNILVSKLICFCNSVINNNLSNSKLCIAIKNKKKNITDLIPSIVKQFTNNDKSSFKIYEKAYTYKTYYEYINSMFQIIFFDIDRELIDILLIPYCLDWLISDEDDFLKMPINYILESQGYDGIYNYDDIINKDGSFVDNPEAGQGTGSISFKIDKPRHYKKAFEYPYLNSDKKLVFLGKDLTNNKDINIEETIQENFNVREVCKTVFNNNINNTGEPSAKRSK